MNRHGTLKFVLYTLLLFVFGCLYWAFGHHFLEFSSDHANLNVGQFVVLILLLVPTAACYFVATLALRKTRGKREQLYIRSLATIAGLLGTLWLLSLDVIEVPWVAISTVFVVFVWLFLPMLLALFFAFRDLTAD